MAAYTPLPVLCQPHGSEFSFARADCDYNSHNINLILCDTALTIASSASISS